MKNQIAPPSKRTYYVYYEVPGGAEVTAHVVVKKTPPFSFVRNEKIRATSVAEAREFFLDGGY